MPANEPDSLLEKKLMFCIGLDFVVDQGKAVPGIIDVLREVKKDHWLFIVGAEVSQKVKPVLDSTRLMSVVPAYMGNLGHPEGMKYAPIAKHYKIVNPEWWMVAVGASPQDVPVDMDIWFLYLPVPPEYRADALRAGVRRFEKKSIAGYESMIKLFTVGDEYRFAHQLIPEALKRNRGR